MRCLIPIFALVIATVTGCGKKYVQCKNYSVLVFDFKLAGRDTAVKYLLYKKGENFVHAIDSGAFPLRSRGNGSASFANVDSLRKYNFDNYDWLVVLLPSGKSYRITETRFTPKEVAGDPKYFSCGNTLSYKIDNSPHTLNPDTAPASGGVYGVIYFDY